MIPRTIPKEEYGTEIDQGFPLTVPFIANSDRRLVKPLDSLVGDLAPKLTSGP
jgi:hypothetical protein